jgi:hypothetical protein
VRRAGLLPDQGEVARCGQLAPARKPGAGSRGRLGGLELPERGAHQRAVAVGRDQLLDLGELGGVEDVPADEELVGFE